MSDKASQGAEVNEQQAWERAEAFRWWVDSSEAPMELADKWFLVCRGYNVTTMLLALCDDVDALLAEKERRDKRDLLVGSNLDWIIGFLEAWVREYPGLGHARTRLADARDALDEREGEQA